jgi:hypothetical protein
MLHMTFKKVKLIPIVIGKNDIGICLVSKPVMQFFYFLIWEELDLKIIHVSN